MFRLLTVIVALLASVACGGSSSSVTSPTTSGGVTVTPLHGTMTASIDGSAWAAIAITTATYTNGILAIGGADGASAIRSIAIGGSFAGPGTFVIGTLPSAANAVLMIGIGPTWTANGVSGGSGTTTLTAISSTGASGTFFFSAVAVPGSGATGTHTVTSGTFNITF